jgi:predicted enzyme related to lactoylglutathione lyase
MPNVDSHAPNTFCWAELATTDPLAAKAFYTELFGWSFHDDQVPGGGTYTMLSLRGRFAGALYAMRKEQSDQGIPSHWMSYVSVADADKTASSVRQLGGKVMAEPFDVQQIGRMAVISDPAGATISIWQPKQAIGAQIVEEPGAMCWNELATRDVEAAKRFYGGVFSWTFETDQGGRYTELKVGDRSIGGILKMDPGWGNIPPHWMPYFAVASCDQSAERAKKLRGDLKVSPTDIPKVGRFSVIQDPTGAVFAIIALA